MAYASRRQSRVTANRDLACTIPGPRQRIDLEIDSV